jgi:hypothetical protein
MPRRIDLANGRARPGHFFARTVTTERTIALAQPHISNFEQAAHTAASHLRITGDGPRRSMAKAPSNWMYDEDEIMKTILSRTAFAALLATTLSAGFVPVASAQVSPANPNYSYDTRGRTAPWGVSHEAGAAYAQAPAAQAFVRNSAPVRDPDPNVRLQALRTQGLFDR